MRVHPKAWVVSTSQPRKLLPVLKLETDGVCFSMDGAFIFCQLLLK